MDRVKHQRSTVSIATLSCHTSMCVVVVFCLTLCMMYGVQVKLLLRVLTENENYFTLDNFNDCLENLELGHMECKSRPTPISKITLQSTGNSLKQSGM